jgi:DNA-binding CsgD family transcriptional regulator
VASTVSDADLRALLGLLETGRAETAAVGLPPAALEQARALVRCEVVAFLDMEPWDQRTHLDQEYPSTQSCDGADAETDDDVFWEHYWDCLPCCYQSVSGDDRSITTISDFYTQRDYHHTGMYTDVLGPQGVEHEAMLCLSAPPGYSRRLLFVRGPGPDFDRRDRLLLALLRPHLNELYQELQRRRRAVPALTARQQQLLQLVARGYSNSDIARELVVSTATVRKHLENIFQRLHVTSRTAAASAAFPPGSCNPGCTRGAPTLNASPGHQQIISPQCPKGPPDRQATRPAQPAQLNPRTQV